MLFSLNVTRSTFTDNAALDIGGALVAETGIINNTNFTGNIGNDGGAVYLSRWHNDS